MKHTSIQMNSDCDAESETFHLIFTENLMFQVYRLFVFGRLCWSGTTQPRNNNLASCS